MEPAGSIEGGVTIKETLKLNAEPAEIGDVFKPITFTI